MVIHIKTDLADCSALVAGDDDGAPAAPIFRPFTGTPMNDVLMGTSGADLVFGFAGTDFIITGTEQTWHPSDPAMETCAAAWATT